MNQTLETTGGNKCYVWDFLLNIVSWSEMHFPNQKLIALYHSYVRLEIEGSGKSWRQNQKIRLRHVDTGGYLHSHDRKYTRIAGGQQEVSPYGMVVCSIWSVVIQRYDLQTTELFILVNIILSLQVCGVGDKRPDNVWLAAEGVYLPVNQQK